MTSSAPSAAALAELYDLLNPWGRSDDFYLELVLSARSVLDVGCGTGGLLHRAREAGHAGRLCGFDPDAGMLSRAQQWTDIEWVATDAASAKWDREFELAVMASHAFQFLVTDDELRASLTAIRSALVDGGLFAFETRNPLLREWEQWVPANSFSTVDAAGASLRVEYDIERPVVGDVVRVGETFVSPSWDGPHTEWASMRFLSVSALNAFLVEAGFVVEAQFGDWDRQPLTDTSSEIITLARRVSER